MNDVDNRVACASRNDKYSKSSLIFKYAFDNCRNLWRVVQNEIRVLAAIIEYSTSNFVTGDKKTAFHTYCEYSQA